MDQLPADVVAALDEGRFVDAIKLLRNCTDLDLKSAKELLERYKAGHSIRVPAVPPPVERTPQVRTNGPDVDLNKVEDSAENRWLLLLLVSLAGIGIVVYLWLRSRAIL